ncbi:hypothetical protein HIM_00729 [Hirsutella minnesotensis 3608]|nr:hypothetical protein HIM_00729 [Hirsutella minnesotensis 3608]
MSSRVIKPVARIGIIGVGQVGGATAYALVLASLARELLLVDIDITLRDGQVRDLSDVAYSHNSVTRVRAASHHEVGQCDIVVITTGTKYTLGQTRLEHVYRNVSIVRDVVDEMTPFPGDTILLVVANPVDLLTSLALELSKLPKDQVFGVGTYLDSVRLEGIIAEEAEVSLESVDANVLGVHGDSQVTAWSRASIGNVPIQESPLHGHRIDRANLDEECKYRSASIIRAKGSTPFGIGSIVSEICASIILDKRKVCPISHFQPDFGCCFSLPVILGRKGIVNTVPMALSDAESAEIAKSAIDLKSMLDNVRGDH